MKLTFEEFKKYVKETKYKNWWNYMKLEDDTDFICLGYDYDASAGELLLLKDAYDYYYTNIIEDRPLILGCN